MTEPVRTTSPHPAGDRLKAAREERRLGLARVSEDTNMGVSYLEALEREDMSVFPGEPYAIGFLRNYAGYLELDVDAVVRDFRNSRAATIAEGGAGAVRGRRSGKHHAGGRSGETGSGLAGPADPVPDRNALSGASPIDLPGTPDRGPDAGPSRKPGTGRRIVAILFAFAALGVLFVLGREYLNAGPGRNAPPATPSEYMIEGSAFEKRIYPGDSMVVTVVSSAYKMTLDSIGESVVLQTPVGQLSLALGEETALDFDKDGTPELHVRIGDFDRNDARSGALIRIEFIARVENGSASSTDIDIGESAVVPAGPGKRTDGILFRAARGPVPFVANISFRTASVFRHEADRKDWVEKHYARGETITVNADNSLILWASNAWAAQITITASGGKSADLDLGGPGEIAVKRIGWSQSEGAWVLKAMEYD